MEAPLIQRMTRMNAELAYRFCVREKLAAEQVSRSRPLFITHEHMREADAADRYEVSVTWHEAGEEEPSTYTLTVEV